MKTQKLKLLLLGTAAAAKLLLFGAAATVSLGLGGCSDSTLDEGSSEDQSELYLSMTDAQGDFTRYEVTVEQLTLHRANGATIETLPNESTIDFAQYVEVTEFLSTATVPAGYYTEAEITLNFNQAELMVENANGNSVPATAVDDDGDPLQQVTLSAVINGGAGFVIRRGRPASLDIDFDLESSNSVSFAADGNSAEVSVNPILIANTSLDDEKERRLRGLLDSVDPSEPSFIVDVRPFQVRDRSYGEVPVQTDEQTLFEIDGNRYTGSEGIEALAALSANAPVITLGVFDFDEKSYTAERVYAGESVPWGDKDVVKGSVVARDGNSLTVLGATVELDDGHFQFHDRVEILLDDDTTVFQQGSTELFAIADISVGQRVTVLGHMSEDSETLDASGTEGTVRMRYSSVSGSVVSLTPFQVNLQHINLRQVSQFDFSGTGITEENDADPDAYDIEHSTLALLTLQPGEAVIARGFPTAFGSAPADFNATTIADVSAFRTRMLVNYGRDGSATAIASLGENGLLLDIESAGEQQYLKQIGIKTALDSLIGVPLITANQGRGLYALSVGQSIDVYTGWDDFIAELNAQLETGLNVQFVHATGYYDETVNQLPARQLIVRLN